jgi:hypothetical protein
VKPIGWGFVQRPPLRTEIRIRAFRKSASDRAKTIVRSAWSKLRL